MIKILPFIFQVYHIEVHERIKTPFTVCKYLHMFQRYLCLENNPKRADWFKTVFLQLNRNTELVRAVDIMMARAKRIYILMVEVNKSIFFFASQYFRKEIENMFFVFLSSYRNTSESLGELKKTVETLACSLYSRSISHSPKLSLVFLLNNQIMNSRFLSRDS